MFLTVGLEKLLEFVGQFGEIPLQILEHDLAIIQLVLDSLLFKLERVAIWRPRAEEQHGTFEGMRCRLEFLTIAFAYRRLDFLDLLGEIPQEEVNYFSEQRGVIADAVQRLLPVHVTFGVRLALLRWRIRWGLDCQISIFRHFFSSNVHSGGRFGAW